MRERLIKESYLALGTIILTVIIGLMIFGIGLFDPKPIDIQLHDTYFVFPKPFFLAIIFIGLMTTTFLVRGIYFKLNNKIINAILTLLLIIVFVGQIIYLDWVNGLETHFGILYSREMDGQTNALAGFNVTKGTLWTLLIITGTIMITTGYKTIKPKRAS